MNDIDIHLRSEKSCVRCSGLLTTQLKLACIAGGIFYHGIIPRSSESLTGHLATREFHHLPTLHQETTSPPTNSKSRWLVARWFLGGELVGGETPWWPDDRIPVNHWLQSCKAAKPRRIFVFFKAIHHHSTPLATKTQRSNHRFTRVFK